jgi:hypothetical protein
LHSLIAGFAELADGVNQIGERGLSFPDRLADTIFHSVL